MTSDGLYSHTYNAENEQTLAAGVTYKYDGDGKRVEKSNGKLYWNGLNSEPLLETDGSGNLQNDYIFLSGKRMARRDSTAVIFPGSSGVCEKASLPDTELLNQGEDRLPCAWVRGVLSYPKAMTSYNEYSFEKATNTQSDYAVRMQTVCRKAHPAFISALDTLPARKKDWFSKHILDPNPCRALALPEAC